MILFTPTNVGYIFFPKENKAILKFPVPSISGQKLTMYLRQPMEVRTQIHKLRLEWELVWTKYLIPYALSVQDMNETLYALGANLGNFYTTPN